MKEFTDEQIIKALEYCSTDVRENTCPKCAFYKKHRCSTLMLNAVSDLINRQKAEIKRLDAENKSIRYCYEQAKSYNDMLAESCEKNCKRFNMTTRAEAIKEFAERLKNTNKFYDCIMAIRNVDKADCVFDTIDNLVKEMTEEK